MTAKQRTLNLHRDLTARILSAKTADDVAACVEFLDLYLDRIEADVCEANAKIADAWGTREYQMTDTAFVPGASHGERYASSGIAAAIRARGEAK